MILPLMHSNGLPTISVILAIQITENWGSSGSGQLRWDKAEEIPLSMSQKTSKKETQGKPEAEMGISEEVLALLTKISDLTQKLFKKSN